MEETCVIGIVRGLIFPIPRHSQYITYALASPIMANVIASDILYSSLIDGMKKKNGVNMIVPRIDISHPFL